MVSGPSLRVSWICLLLFSGGVCRPAERDSRYRFSATKGFSGRAGPVLFDSSPGNQSPSGPGTPFVASNWSPGYELNRFIVGPDSNAPEALSQGAGSSTSLIQSRNGYRRAAVVSSHTRYSPFYPKPPPRQTPGGKV